MCVLHRESIGQYQKALVLAEQEQKDAGVRAEALQGALKQQMKETEQANSRVTQLQKKVAEVQFSAQLWGGVCGVQRATSTVGCHGCAAEGREAEGPGSHAEQDHAGTTCGGVVI